MCQLFTYKGRIGRLVYFGRSAGVFLAAAVAAGIVIGVAIATEVHAILFLLLPIWAVVVVAQVMLSIRWLHDVDLSGRWYLPGLLAMMVGGQMASSGEPMAALIGTILYILGRPGSCC
jgi:uncharacterized membrane protein YhaH (DUF805 family)